MEGKVDSPRSRTMNASAAAEAAAPAFAGDRRASCDQLRKEVVGQRRSRGCPCCGPLGNDTPRIQLPHYYLKPCIGIVGSSVSHTGAILLGRLTYLPS